MGAQGTTTVNFGAFPGTSDASVDVSGQAGFVATSLVEAWVFPVATADHSVDEHFVEPLRAQARYKVDGTFTIYVLNASDLRDLVSDIGTLVYGLWTVAWVWN